MNSRILFLSFFVGALAACGGTDKTVAPPPSKTVPPPPSSAGAASIAATAGNDQAATIKHLLPLSLVVTVRNSAGAPVSGVTVDWTIPSGDGVLSPASAVTDANGQASTTLHFGDVPGSHAVVATVKGTTLKADFNETASAPIILHYDGTSWSTGLEDTFGGFVRVQSVSGLAQSRAFAGGLGCSESTGLSYDGTAWHGSCKGGGPEVRSVAANGPDDIFAVEDLARPLFYPSYVSHYDGQAWSVVYNHGSPLSPLPDLRAVGTRAAHDAIIVGDAGTIVRFDGGWSTQQSGTTQNLRAVWLDKATSAAFAVGENGTILYWNGSNWQLQSTGTTQALNAVWGTSASNVFAVGEGGTVLHYDGSNWTAQTSGSTKSLRGVWGSGPGSVFAVGLAGTILHFDGTNWATQPANAAMDILGVWGTSASNVFAVGGPF